jgi:hypothetical protein
MPFENESQREKAPDLRAIPTPGRSGAKLVSREIDTRDRDCFAHSILHRRQAAPIASNQS